MNINVNLNTPVSLPSRRRLMSAILASGLPSFPLSSHAQGPQSGTFPSGTITLIVPWPAGGATDITLRLLAEIAGKQLGQKIIIENRPGAGGSMAMPLLQQAAPDGYTIAQMPQPAFRVPYLQKVSWDPVRDTTPILQLSGVTFGIVVASNSPFRTLDDMLTYAVAHPGLLSVSTNGNGTTPHLVMEELMAGRNAKYIHVPYKGTAEQMLAVASGQVMAGVNSNGFAPYVDTGRLRLLCTFAENRTKRWPQVPTLRELGYDIVATSPYGLVGPRGMPAAVVQTLHDAFKTALFDAQEVAELAKYDQEVLYLGPQAYGKSMAEIYALERVNVERLGMMRSVSK